MNITKKIKKTILVSLLIIISGAVSVLFSSVVSAENTNDHIINSCGLVIKESGTYVLKNDLVCARSNMGEDKENVIKVIASNVVIDGRGHTITGVSNEWQWSPTLTGIRLEGVSNVIVKNLNIKYLGAGIYMRNTRNSTIKNIKSSTMSELSLYFSDRNKIIGNVFNNMGCCLGIYMWSSSHNLIELNTIKAVETTTIVVGSNYNRISKNKFIGSYGVSFSGCKGNRFMNNVLNMSYEANDNSHLNGKPIYCDRNSSLNFGCGNVSNSPKSMDCMLYNNNITTDSCNTREKYPR
ncbi:MAG: NosD domain-containing protein [Patescibacteria group bacterium]